jgi:hypothetical protein
VAGDLKLDLTRRVALTGLLRSDRDRYRSCRKAAQWARSSIWLRTGAATRGSSPTGARSSSYASSAWPSRSVSGTPRRERTERILEDLLTIVLDWSASEINHQVGYADILLTRLGIKHLIIEAKRPGGLAWNRRAIDQARRYAAEQKVSSIAVSDGHMLYACDVTHGGIRDRLYCSLRDPDPPHSLWWLSIDGIYRERAELQGAALSLLPDPAPAETDTSPNAAHDAQLLHHKYQLPARRAASGMDKAWLADTTEQARFDRSVGPGSAPGTALTIGGSNAGSARFARPDRATD